MDRFSVVWYVRADRDGRGDVLKVNRATMQLFVVIVVDLYLESFEIVNAEIGVVPIHFGDINTNFIKQFKDR